MLRSALVSISTCLALVGLAAPASAQDIASVVAKARDQVEGGNFQDALRTLSMIKNKTLPPQVAVDASLLETTALLVVQGPDAATTACQKAVTASGFDPEVARDQSPKIRDACRAAAKQVRAGRLAAEGVELSKLDVKAPEVAYQPIRVSAEATKRPAWLKVVARVKSSELESAFDVPLIPSQEGPMLGTLDPSWIRPGSKLRVALVAQDKFGDLGQPASEVSIDVPKAEAAIALGTVPKGAKVALDGDPAKPDGGGRIATTPGKHEVSMTLEDGSYAEAEVELRRGLVTRVALAPQAPSPSRVGPWIATGTSVALLVAGGVLLINAESRRSELEEAAARREPGTDLPASDYADLAEIDDERLIFQNVGIGLMAGGGALAVLATVLWLVPTDGSSASASIRPELGPGYFGVSGTF
jgi:hypothetical protein